MNLDTLVRAGQPPWHPVPAAEDIDVWDKYEFPICGSYRLASAIQRQGPSEREGFD